MNNNLLETGIYTVPEAARLLSIPQRKLRGWVSGYSPARLDPLIQNEIGKLDNALALSFVNLMEARLIHAFAQQGVSVKSIRCMAEEARRFLDHPHPFATDILFRTDGKKIFIVVAEKTGDKRLYDLKSKNWAFYDILSDQLKEGVVYDTNGNAEAWQPRKKIAPNVVIHPKIAFGQPILRESGVPTRALLDAFSAEGETYESVSAWYDVPVDQVKEAIRFEMELDMAA